MLSTFRPSSGVAKPPASRSDRSSPPLDLTPDRSGHRVHFLDGIRGWAAIVVLNSHMALLLGDLNPLYTSRAFWFVTDGRLAVVVFFVLSGYALTVSHIRRSREILARSAVSRYFRLAIPIAFVCVAAWALRAGHLFANVAAAKHLTPLMGDWLAPIFSFHMSLGGALKFAAYDVFFSYDAARSYNPALWTMATELIGSVFIFSYLAIFRLQGDVRWPLLGGSFLVLFAFSPFVSCFAAGCAIAEADQRWPVRSRYGDWPSAALIVLVAALVTWSPTETVDDRFGVIYAAGLVWAVSSSRSLRSFFSSTVSTWLGRISFSLYMVQFLVICSFSCAMIVALLGLGVSSVACANATLVASVPLSLAVAAVLSEGERFSMRVSRRIAEMILSA